MWEGTTSYLVQCGGSGERMWEGTTSYLVHTFTGCGFGLLTQISLMSADPGLMHVACSFLLTPKNFVLSSLSLLTRKEERDVSWPGWVGKA